MAEPDLVERGERRHEQCRFGMLTPMHELRPSFDPHGAVRFDERPAGVMPSCAWKPEHPIPPAALRAWGGLVEFARDCAVCQCFAPIELSKTTPTLPENTARDE